ncbi:MAG TPA: hypothetical protein VMV77_03830 [Bacteroidales bacterium]|nr:hypothetical protein [Bacteroidales bacterium]
MTKFIHEIILKINKAYHGRDWYTIREECYNLHELGYQKALEDVKKDTEAITTHWYDDEHEIDTIDRQDVLIVLVKLEKKEAGKS